MRIPFILEKAAEEFGTACAWRESGRAVSYARALARVRGLAAMFAAEGVQPGDRIALLARNTPGCWTTYFAAAWQGAILVPLNTRLAAAEIRAILDDSGARFVVLDREAPHGAELLEGCGLPVVPLSETAEEWEAAAGTGPPVSGPDDEPAHLYYTSGTTGSPKGVVLTHRNVTSHALAAMAELSLCDRDVWLHAAPMFHLADAWATFAITWAGGRHAFLPSFAAPAAIQVLRHEAVTITNLVPTMLNAMVHAEGARGAYPALRVVLSGGAPIAPTLVQTVMDTFGCDYIQTYGMTETSPYLTLSRLRGDLYAAGASDQFRYKAKTGRPFASVRLRVVRTNGEPVARDGREVGEIEVCGDTVTPGYWNRPAETAAVFRDGWLRTGDLAVMDHHGYVDIVDRCKDMIITGGENVYSTEVEHALAAHPAVLEVAVVGIPDPTWGEKVAAAVVLKAGHGVSGPELVRHCRGLIAHFKAPRWIQFLDALPKTGSGKVRKNDVREQLRAAAVAEPSSAS